MGFKETVQDMARKILEQSLKQWIGKALLAVIPALAVWGWQAAEKAKNEMILSPVRPELARLQTKIVSVNYRLDSVVKKVDSVDGKVDRAYVQNKRFQVAQMQADPRLRSHIENMSSEGRAAKARRVKDEEILDNLADNQ